MGSAEMESRPNSSFSLIYLFLAFSMSSIDMWRNVSSHTPATPGFTRVGGHSTRPNLSNFD